MLHSADELGGVVAQVSCDIARHTLHGIKVKHAHFARNALLAVSVVHGTVRLVALEFDDAAEVVRLQSLSDDRGVSQRVDLTSLRCLVLGNGHVAVGKHFIVGSSCPRVQV